MLSKGDRIKQVGTGQLVLHCSAAALSPNAFQYCLSGEGGVCGVWVLSVGPCVLLEGEREVCISGRHNLCGPKFARQ